MIFKQVSDRAIVLAPKKTILDHLINIFLSSGHFEMKCCVVRFQTSNSLS